MIEFFTKNNGVLYDCKATSEFGDHIFVGAEFSKRAKPQNFLTQAVKLLQISSQSNHDELRIS